MGLDGWIRAWKKKGWLLSGNEAEYLEERQELSRLESCVDVQVLRTRENQPIDTVNTLALADALAFRGALNGSNAIIDLASEAEEGAKKNAKSWAGKLFELAGYSRDSQ